MSELSLCRYTLEEAGSNPKVKARALHQQLTGQGISEGVIPIEVIATSLGIGEIRYDANLAFEGAVIMTPNKSDGSILVKKAAPPRMRFTIAHELFHFLSDQHQPVNGAFKCKASDMRVGTDFKPRTAEQKARAKHYRQEAEANQFAAEILMPFERVKRRLNAEPDLEHVLSISHEFGVSKEAAARHYVSRNGDTVAILFIKDGLLRYAARSEEFPWVKILRGQAVPYVPKPRPGSKVSDVDDDEILNWVDLPRRHQFGEEISLSGQWIWDGAIGCRRGIGRVGRVAMNEIP